MSKSGLTKSQNLAVISEGNVIVSAGAGSGKTRVLTERVMRKISEGVKIDEFLILTFTNAAAKQMRDKIKSALKKANNFEEMNKVDASHIETFDAYALFIVKKYGFKLSLPTSINNVPEDVIKVKVKNEVVAIFNEYYESGDISFKNFIQRYCTNNDDKLVDFVIGFYNFALEQLNFDDFINNYEKNLFSKSKLDKDFDVFYNLISKKVDEIKGKIDLISDNDLRAKLKDYFCDLYAYTNQKEFFDALKTFSKDVTGRSKRIPNKKKYLNNDKELQEEIKDLKNQIKDISFNIVFYFNNDENDIKNFFPIVIEIAKKVRERILNFEKSKGYFTFNDIAHFAYEIVSKNEDVREEIRNKTKLIFVDEYQDNSDLQNEFLSLIENNNLFCVGDVKQSIYLFRGANPKNFMDRYEKYKKNEGGTAIDLNDNFRSRKEMIKSINDIFAKLMTLNFGGADYAASHIINARNPAYENEGKIDGEHGIFLIKGSGDPKNPITSSELIIEDIKKRIQNKQQIYDRDQKLVRDVTYKDFAILSPVDVGSMEQLEKDLSQANIPVVALYNEKLLENPAIIVVISILNCSRIIAQGISKDSIGDFKHYYVSVVRSFLYRYKDDKIYQLLAESNDYTNDEVFLKLKSFGYKHKSSGLKETYNDLLTEFSIVDKLKYLKNPLSYIYKLEVLDEKIKVMDELNLNVDDFISYLEDLNKNDIEMEAKHSTYSNNAVTLTTIHKSKGLEYKIVYLINLNDQKKKKDTYFFNNNYCATLPSYSFNLGLKVSINSIQQYLSKIELESRFFEEKLRLLYVALTRAEDTFIIVDNKNILSDGKSVNKEEINGVGKFLKTEICQTKFNESKYSSMQLKTDEDLKKSQIKFTKELKIEEPLNLSFDKTNAKNNASKDIDYDVDLSLLQKGTHMHLLMQVVDFLSKDTSFIKDNFERSIIKKVLGNDLFLKIDKETKIFKEYQFVDLINKRNGVIDLLMVFKDSAYIVDYKLKHIDDEAYKKQLKVYFDYVSGYFKKDCKCFLLSLMDGVLKEVNLDE